MREQLISYVNLLFAGAENAGDMKEEILQNTLDRYDDLVAQGKTPEAAYRLAISGIGDISEILGTGSNAQGASVPTTPQVSPEKPLWKQICNVLGIMCYILCPIPLFQLQNENGLCALLCFVALGVGLQVFASWKPQPVTSEAQQEKAKKEWTVSRIIGLIGLILYLAVSFRTGAWWITWVIFPAINGVNHLLTLISDMVKHPEQAPDKSIVKLILYSLLILVCLGALIVSTTGVVSGSPFRLNIPWSTSKTAETTANTGNFPAGNVDNIVVDWVSGSIRVETWDGDEISYLVPSDEEKNNPTAYTLDKGTLTLRYQSGQTLNLGWGQSSKKDLLIRIPKHKNLVALTVNSVSANITLKDLVTNNLFVDTTSGSFTADNCTTAYLDLNGVSGSMDYTGSAETIRADTTSGKVSLRLENEPISLDFDSVSADLNLTLPKGTGFRCQMDSVSGKFQCEEPVLTLEDGSWQSGSGALDISADTVSGNVSVVEQ